MKKFLCFTTLLASFPLQAATIDFEAQGAGAPPAFNNTLNSPLTIGIATFSGGQLLKNEASSADTTAVYATAGGAPYLNPLTISFFQPINGFSLAVTNNTPDTYTVAGNVGGSQSLSLNANAFQIFNLAGAGITSVTISSATPVFWDFAIDDVTFSTGSTAVPEPALFVPAGLLLLSALLRIRRPYVRRPLRLSNASTNVSASQS